VALALLSASPWPLKEARGTTVLGSKGPAALFDRHRRGKPAMPSDHDYSRKPRRAARKDPRGRTPTRRVAFCNAKHCN
jgi:hypothetical protein